MLIFLSEKERKARSKFTFYVKNKVLRSPSTALQLLMLTVMIIET